MGTSELPIDPNLFEYAVHDTYVQTYAYIFILRHTYNLC